MNAPFDRDQSMQVMRYDAERIVDEVIQQKMDRTIYQLISKRVNELREEVMDYVDGRWSDAQKPSGEVRYFGGSLIHNRQDSSSIDFLQSGTGATAQNLQAWARARSVNLVDYLPVGYVLDGSVDYTTQIGKWLTACAGRCGIAPAGTFLFTSITVSADTVIVGAGKEKTKFNSATTGTAVTLGGNRIFLADMWINQSSGSVQGKGIVGTGVSFFATQRVEVTGFTYDLYCDKSVYHSHKDSKFTGGANGIYYWGNAGAWNVDWFNNQILLDNVVAEGTTLGCYIKGMGVSIPLIDVSSSNIGLQLQGDSASSPAMSIHIGSLYSELSDTVIKMQYAYAQLSSAYMQGGASAGARFTTLFNLDNAQLTVTGPIRGLDFWTDKYILTNSSYLQNMGTQDLGFGADISTTSVDATSHAVHSDYAEGTFTATMTNVTGTPTSTISYVRIGKMVTLYIPSLSGASTDTTAPNMTGLPVSLTPVSNQFHYGRVVDNSTTISSNIGITTASTINVYADVTLSTTFTASGNKGVGAQAVSYALY